MTHPNDQSPLGEMRRRLYLLEVRAAQQGISVDPSVLIEIEDTKRRIQQLEQAQTSTQPSAPNMASAVTNAPPSSTTSSAARNQPAPTSSNQAGRINPTIIVAIIGLISAVLVALIARETISVGGTNSTPSPLPAVVYNVRVQSSANGNNIPNAKVTIEISGEAPVDGYADTNGFARLSIDGRHAGKAARVIIEAQGFKTIVQNITIQADALPDVIKLEPSA